MEKYDSYKFSGIDWIGEIPTHWETVKLKYLTESRKELSEDGREELLSVTESRGIVKRREFKGNDENLSRSENLTGYRLVKQGNLVNNIMLMWKRGLGVSPYDGIVSPAYSVFSFMNNCHPAYFHYLLRSEEYITEFRRNSTGVVLSRLRLYDDSFGSVFSHYPPVNEQQLISRYLDKKTKQIDSLIEKIQKKIELLKEQRTSLINQCVTKGLDPNVEMKDSGVEWIGEIPSHWEQTKLGYLGSLSNGVSRGSEYFGKGHPFITYGDVYKNDVISHPSSLCMSDERDWVTYSVCKGDIFFTRTSETTDDIGISSVCMDTIEKCCFSGFLIRFRPKGERLSPSFSRFYFRSTFPLIHFTKEMNQVTRSSLSQGLLKTCHVLIPPLQEQERISSYLEGTLEKLDFISEREIKRIDLLKEYRQSLISSVVTGKVRVTEDMI